MMTSGAPNSASAALASARPWAVATAQPHRLQENAHAFEHARFVVDGENLESVQRLARRDGLGGAGLRREFRAPRVRAAR